MPEPEELEMNPRKVRAGLAIISVIVLGAGVLALIVDDPLGKTVMLAVAALGFIRVVLLTRAIRREAQSQAE